MDKDLIYLNAQGYSLYWSAVRKHYLITKNWKLDDLWMKLDYLGSLESIAVLEMLYPDFEPKMNIEQIKHVLRSSEAAIHNNAEGWY